MRSSHGKATRSFRKESKDMDDNKALILNIQRLSTEDGPGLRTTVFFKGCNLRCVWCHNPESLSSEKQIEWYAARCMGCGLCVTACPTHSIRREEAGFVINRETCIACESCVKRCPTLAMEVQGTQWNLEELVYEVLKDKNYFGVDGGITASGGECLLQGKFITAFFKRLRAKGIHTALDTAGLVRQDVFAKVLPYTSLVLLDLKIFERQRHQKYTSVDNEVILKNARYIAEYCALHPDTKLWIRTPVIPHITDTEQNILYIGKFITEYLQPVVERWELLAFNNLCKDKYERLDMDWQLNDIALIKQEKMEELYEVALKSGVDPEKVIWTGAMKTETEAPREAEI